MAFVEMFFVLLLAPSLAAIAVQGGAAKKIGWYLFTAVATMMGLVIGSLVSDPLGNLVGMILAGMVMVAIAGASGKRCPSCRSRIHAEAKVCPRCQREVPKSGGMLPATTTHYRPQRVEKPPAPSAPTVLCAETIFCTECGAQTPADSVFCGRCAARIIRPAQSHAVPPQVGPPVPAEIALRSTRPWYREWTTIIFTIMVAATLIGAVVLGVREQPVRKSVKINPEAAGHRITYLVTSGLPSEGKTISLTWSNAEGGTDQTESSTPWTKELRVSPGFTAYVSAQLGGRGDDIQCEIFIDGTNFKRSSSSGKYAISTCSGAVP